VRGCAARLGLRWARWPGLRSPWPTRGPRSSCPHPRLGDPAPHQGGPTCLRSSCRLPGMALLGCSEDELKDLAQSMGEQRFRGQQLLQGLMKGARLLEDIPGVRGVQDASGGRGVQDIPRGRGVRDTPGGHGVQDAPGGRGVQDTPGGHGVRDTPGGHGVRDIPGGHGVQDSLGCVRFRTSLGCVATAAMGGRRICASRGDEPGGGGGQGFCSVCV
jgi:hypothetical protein